MSLGSNLGTSRPNSLNAEQTIGLVTAGAISLAITGCGGSSSSGGGQPEGQEPALPQLDGGQINDAVSIERIALHVDTDQATTLSVVGTDDANGVNFKSESAKKHLPYFNLNGRQLPNDPGKDEATLHFGFDLVEEGSGSAHCHIILNPAHIDVVNSDPSAFRQSKRLLDATGFGATWGEIEAAMGIDYDSLVDEIVDSIRTDHYTNPPSFERTEEFQNTPHILPTRDRLALPGDQLQRFTAMIFDWKTELRRWWHQEILKTPHQLTERLVLFWHGIWTSSLAETGYPQLMYNQNKLLRQHCTDFKTMARELTRDPAMVQYLDSESNTKNRPNENFARELVELFTLGEGQEYNEFDVAQIARCFTGYTLNDRFEFQFMRQRHDTGRKTIFGVDRGNISGDEVLELIFAKRRCAEYICERLVIEFLGRESNGKPLASLVQRLTNIFYPDYDLKPVLKTLFKHQEFRKAARRGTRVKSPVELIIGTFRRLEVDYSDRMSRDWILWQHVACEQDLLRPPSVKGWPDGNLWVDAKNLLVRIRRCHNIANSYSSLVPKHILDQDNNGNVKSPTALDMLMLPLDRLSQPASLRANTYLRSLLTDPTYQLV